MGEGYEVDLPEDAGMKPPRGFNPFGGFQVIFQ
jgi:hypothetical protein